MLSDIAAYSGGRSTGENFPVALRILPAEVRARLAAVYSYARFVDEVGDAAPGDRTRLLNDIEADVRALSGGTARLPVVRALGPVVAQCRVPLEPFLDLIEANRTDQVVTSYASYDALLDYCRLSAAPVGRIVLHVAGAATPANVADSDVVCAALQVLEHCQDVAEDAAAGRVYLPADELAAAGVRPAELRPGATPAPLRAVIARQVERSVAGLDGSGTALVGRLSGWARVAVAGYVAGGSATAAALRRADHDVLARLITPSKAGTAARAARLWARSGHGR